MESFANVIKGILRLEGKTKQNDLVMNAGLVEGYNATRKFSDRLSVCHAPSVNMVFTQSGDVKVCCHNATYNIGSWPLQTIEEIWSGKKVEELRGYMRQYDLMHGCEVCDYEINRMLFDNIPAKHFDTLPRNTIYPTMMEFQFANTCNLECVMCIGEYSSLIRKNREKLPPIISPYNKEFIKQVEKFIPHLHETRFSSSGEAFSIDLNYELWEMIIKLNPNCLIMVQTNGTILTERVKKILSKGNFKIGVSLDSLQKEVYEKIRINANFNKVIENVNWFSQHMAQGKNTFALAMCVMRQNWRELPEYVQFCNRLNANAIFHKVWDPKRYALNNLPALELKEMHDYLSSFDLPEISLYEKRNKRHYQYFVSVIYGWYKEAVDREKNIPEFNHIPANQLIAIVSEKIENYIDRLSLQAQEKYHLKEICLAKLVSMLQLMNTGEQEVLLRQLYFVNPALMIEPLEQKTAEELLLHAQKFINRENF